MSQTNGAKTMVEGERAGVGGVRGRQQWGQSPVVTFVDDIRIDNKVEKHQRRRRFGLR